MAFSSLPSLGALRAFEAAARLESISKAAIELHVTHGAVSRQVRTLEQALGQPLFDRIGRGLVLTPAGHRLRDACGQAFTQLSQAWHELHPNQAGDTLVLGCSSSVLARWVIPRLERLQRALPDIRLHFSAQESAAPEPGVDALLLLGQTPWPSEWHVLELADEIIGPVIGARHPNLTKLQHQPPTTLLSERLLHTTSRPQAWPQWAAANGLNPQALQLGEGFPHLYYLLEAAASGLGIAIAPQPLVAEDLASGRLLAPWGFITTQGRWILCTKNRTQDSRLQALAMWIRAELKTH